MPNVAADIRSMVTRDFGVTAAVGGTAGGGGTTVYVIPSIASNDDTMAGGDSIIAGRTKVLRCASADVTGVEPGDYVVFQGTTYRARLVQLDAQGYLTRIFLGKA